MIFPYVKQANTKMQVHKYTNTEHTTKWQKKTCGIFLKQFYNSSNMINAESAQFTRSSLFCWGHKVTFFSPIRAKLQNIICIPTTLRTLDFIIWIQQWSNLNLLDRQHAGQVPVAGSQLLLLLVLLDQDLNKNLISVSPWPWLRWERHSPESCAPTCPGSPSPRRWCRRLPGQPEQHFSDQP